MSGREAFEESYPFLFRVTLYADGVMHAEGHHRTEGLGDALRIIADAADAGRITWLEGARGRCIRRDAARSCSGSCVTASTTSRPNDPAHETDQGNPGDSQ